MSSRNCSLHSDFAFAAPVCLSLSTFTPRQCIILCKPHRTAVPSPQVRAVTHLPPPATSGPSQTARASPVESAASPPSRVADTALPPNTVPYFAYFSNLNPRKIGPTAVLEPRRFPILRSSRAVLRDHELVFNVPAVPPEPVFANIRRRPAARVVGVVHWLSPRHFEALARSEGVLSADPLLRLLSPMLRTPVVQSVRVVVDGGEIVEARTIVFRLTAPDWLRPRPSRRYRQVAVDGAKYWGLDPTYVEDVLEKIDVDVGPLGGFALYVEPRPHVLDRANPNEKFGEPLSEMYSPYASFCAEYAVDKLEASESATKDSRLRLVPLSRPPTMGSDRRLLYFIPGIDGAGKSVLGQVHDIDEDGVYDLRTFVYPPDNRETLEQLASELIRMIAEDAAGRPVSIAGESMGGMLIVLLALENIRRMSATDIPDLPTLDIDLVMLLNPATSFRRSEPRALWDFLLSLKLPTEVYKALVPPMLLPVLIEPSSVMDSFSAEIAPRLVKMLRHLNELPKLLPQSALEHRIGMLSSVEVSDEQLATLAGPYGPKDVSLIVAANDRLVPSLSECYRMRRAIPGLYSLILPCGGHTIMFDRRFNLSDFLRPFRGGPRAEQVRHELPVPAPRSEILRRREAFRKRHASISSDNRATEPRMFMSNLRGFLKESLVRSAPVFIGVENVPGYDPSRPILFVGNHTLLGWLDGMLPLMHLLEERGALARPLTHPLLFRSASALNGISFPGTGLATEEDMYKYGLLPVSPLQLAKSLASGQWTILFPGGAAEALKQSDKEKYTLKWPKDPEFVRMCALLGAQIIPLATVGTEDMVRIIANSETTKRVYQTGRRLLGQDPDISFAGDDARKWQGAETQAAMIPPLIVPSAGADRLYYRFGKPITVPEEAFTDKDVERGIYEEARQGVEYGMQMLLRRRLHDDFRDEEKRKGYKARYGENVGIPASPAWSWVQGDMAYLDEESQPTRF